MPFIDEPVFPSPEAGGVSRVGMVIGNCSYAVRPLSNPRNDAKDIAAALSRIGFVGLAPIGDTFAVDPSRPGVSAIYDLDLIRFGRAVDAFKRAANGASQAVLYYAGHGVEVDNANYLIPVDATIQNRGDVKTHTMPVKRVLEGLQAVSGLGLVILDCCRDDPFEQTRGWMGRGLAAVETAGNLLVAYAAKPGQVAHDRISVLGQHNEFKDNSPYAAALLKNIEKPGLEIMDLLREVKDEVLSFTQNLQEPWNLGSLGKRREYLVPPEEQPVVPEGPLDERMIEHTRWIFLQRRDTLDDLEEFIRRFPCGEYIADARQLLRDRIAACEDAERLRRFTARFPDSEHRAFAFERIAEILSTAVAQKSPEPPPSAPAGSKEASQAPLETVSQRTPKLPPPRPPWAGRLLDPGSTVDTSTVKPFDKPRS